MAKSGSVIAAIKAKPNARGRRSHLPLECSTKSCTHDFLISYPTNKDVKTVRKCGACFATPPQASLTTKQAKNLKLLKQLGF